MNPKDLQIKDYHYNLPDERIARYPLEERDSSKLLIYNGGKIEEANYKNLAHYLPEGSFLLFNNTKVVEARLIFQKDTGGLIEIFCLAPHTQYKDITSAMLTPGQVWWKCLVGGASKWKHGMVLHKKLDENTLLEARIVEKHTEDFTIEFTWNNDKSFAEILHIAGVLPIPPYLKRHTETSDAERYQTIYAMHKGSVAAPTAGLHFTEALFTKLKQKNIQHGFVTLHVGAGTFKPVTAATMEGHHMHEELMEVSVNVINELVPNLGKIFCVGTTSMRTLESLYWMGVKTIINPEVNLQSLTVSQWEPYSLPQGHSVQHALKSLKQWLINQQLAEVFVPTQIMITPGYTPRMIEGIITNFHQPQSTLLLLIAATIGNEWRTIYQYALDNNYRFLSYGDGCLLFKQSPENRA